MQATLMETRSGLLCSFVSAAFLLIVPSGSSPAITAEAEVFIVLPNEATRYGGQQGREADITELLATAERTDGVLGVFRQTIAPKNGPPTHLHAIEAEFCYVVSGQFNFKLGERVVSAPAGSFIFIPRKPRIRFRTPEWNLTCCCSA